MCDVVDGVCPPLLGSCVCLHVSLCLCSWTSVPSLSVLSPSVLLCLLQSVFSLFVSDHFLLRCNLRSVFCRAVTLYQCLCASPSASAPVSLRMLACNLLVCLVIGGWLYQSVRVGLSISFVCGLSRFARHWLQSQPDLPCVSTPCSSTRAADWQNTPIRGQQCLSATLLYA